MLSISRQSAAPFRMNSAAVSRCKPWTKNMRGMSFFIWPKRSSTCVSCQFGLGLLGHDKVKELRTQPFGELLGSDNYI